MSVALLIKKLHGCKTLVPSSLTRGGRFSLILASALMASQAVAVVPVVESTPTIEIVSADDAFPPPPVSEVPAVAKDEYQAAAANTAEGGTAYLLNVVDQLRSEMMGLRGQVEEQAYLIKQLQQENRDRYLDLDERVARLSGSAVTTLPASVKPTENTFKSATAASDDTAAEKVVYQNAFQLIRDKRFDDAQKALKKQLADYPDGHYADNAQYWLGEVQMAQGQYPDAKNAFLAVLKGFPKSEKVPDATYKLGRLSDLLGDKKQARDYLESVISKYPESAASRLSDTYLQNLGDS